MHVCDKRPTIKQCMKLFAATNETIGLKCVTLKSVPTILSDDIEYGSVYIVDETIYQVNGLYFTLDDIQQICGSIVTINPE